MFDKKNWFFEVHEDFVAMGLQYKRVLFDEKSPWQRVQILETKGHGPMLVNDGIIMTSKRDEYIYHEMIAHVPLFTHPSPQQVLIIGGGDGGTAREVLKHETVQKCVMVEIDRMVTEACKKHLKATGQGLEHPKLDLKFEDGAAFMARSENLFDVIIIDSSDPIGPSTVLFSEGFYKDIFKALKEDGLLVAQGESPFYSKKFQKGLLEMAGNLFKTAGFYNYSNLTYPGGFWSFLFASKKYHPLKDFRSNKDLSLRYYNEDMHRASFSRPEFLKSYFGSLWKI